MSGDRTLVKNEWHRQITNTTEKTSSSHSQHTNVETRNDETNVPLNEPTTSVTTDTTRDYAIAGTSKSQTVHDNEPKLWSHAMKSSSTYSQLFPARHKYVNCSIIASFYSFIFLQIISE